VSVGLVGHTFLATLGLGALLRASEWLFVALKLVGACYLAWLGIQLILTRTVAIAAGASSARPLSRHLVNGATSNLSNPKIAIFYFAFLPQFVQVGAAHPTLTIFVLGLAFAALTFLIKGPVAVFAGRLSAWFRSRPAALVWLYRSSGVVLLGLAVRLALERRE